MISFILSIVALLVLALLFVVPVLLRKNQPMTEDFDDYNVAIARDRLKELKQQRDDGEISEEIYQQLHDELETTLAIDLDANRHAETANVSGNASRNRFIPVLMMVAVPLLAVLVYAQIGNFDAATGKLTGNTSIPAGENRGEMTIAEAVAKLEQRLQEQPDNAEGWFMLARTYMRLQQYQKSADAYEKLIALVGENELQVMLGYADALAMNEGGQLTGSALPIVEKVKAMDPHNPTVLWMVGTAESQQGNFKQALTYWYELRPMLGDEPEALAQLNQLIRGVEKQLGDDLVAELKAELPQLAEQAATEVDSGPLAEITITVDLDPQLRDRVQPDDTLFIYAKAIDGPPMPLAALKLTAAELPALVTLNDSMAMMPEMRLSKFETVNVTAVISKSARPGIQSGDLYVEHGPVNVFDREHVSLLIETVK
jgi:cytochrome c-type biogenesis protein CcmH